MVSRASLGFVPSSRLNVFLPLSILSSIWARTFPGSDCVAGETAAEPSIVERASPSDASFSSSDVFLGTSVLSMCKGFEGSSPVEAGTVRRPAFLAAAATVAPAGTVVRAGSSLAAAGVTFLEAFFFFPPAIKKKS